MDVIYSCVASISGRASIIQKGQSGIYEKAGVLDDVLKLDSNVSDSICLSAEATIIDGDDAYLLSQVSGGIKVIEASCTDIMLNGGEDVINRQKIVVPDFVIGATFGTIPVPLNDVRYIILAGDKTGDLYALNPWISGYAFDGIDYCAYLNALDDLVMPLSHIGDQYNLWHGSAPSSFYYRYGYPVETGNAHLFSYLLGSLGDPVTWDNYTMAGCSNIMEIVLYLRLALSISSSVYWYSAWGDQGLGTKFNYNNICESINEVRSSLGMDGFTFSALPKYYSIAFTTSLYRAVGKLVWLADNLVRGHYNELGEWIIEQQNVLSTSLGYIGASWDQVSDTRLTSLGYSFLSAYNSYEDGVWYTYTSRWAPYWVAYDS